MTRHLKTLFLILVVVFILAGFFTEHEHAVFLWHTIPAIDAIFGVLGAFLLIFAIKVLGTFATRKEGFYD